jgi:hypothetical protein
MNFISISDLKTKPSAAIAQAIDYPVAVQSRSKTKAYLVGKDLYEKLIAFIEDNIDIEAVRKADFSKKQDFEKVVKELGI